MKLDTYLGFIYDLAKKNIQFLRILTKKKTMTRLLDLMCKYNPNAMVYVQTHPPFEKLILTVSFIARSIPCIVDPQDPSNVIHAEEDRETMIARLTQERGQSGFHVPLRQSYSLDGLPESEQAELSLPDDCYAALFIHLK